MALVGQEICEIASLNEKGVGLANTNQGEVSLPLTLPGETVEFERHRYRGNTNFLLKKILVPSKDRVIPPCKHFSHCGGCSLQHAHPLAYDKIKLNFIEKALGYFSINTKINEMITIPYGNRRRAVFEAIKKNNQVFLGFKRYNSHQIINIDNCLVLLPEINQLISPLKTALFDYLQAKQKAQISLTMADNGIDLLIATTGLNLEFINKLKNKMSVIFNDETKIIRLTLVSGEFKKVIFLSEVPYVKFGGVEVEIDANSFLQSSKKSDEILEKLILSFLLQNRDFSNIKYKVADLFCGRGTYTIILSKEFLVDGFEFDRNSLDALAKAVGNIINSVKLERRDLSALPLKKNELDKYHFVVINPPRQGAMEQVAELSRCAVKKICYISCNPSTFARDAKVLINGGYELLEITPVDQFYWSSHVELVGYFRKMR